MELELKAIIELAQQESQPASRLLWAAANQVFGSVEMGCIEDFDGEPASNGYTPTHIHSILANGREYELDFCRKVEANVWEVRLREALPVIAVPAALLHAARVAFWGICPNTGNLQEDHRPEVFAAEAAEKGVSCDWFENKPIRYVNSLDFKLDVTLNTASFMAWYKKRQQTYRRREFPTRGDGWQLV